MKDYTVKSVKKHLKEMAEVIKILKQLKKIERNRNFTGLNPHLVDSLIKQCYYQGKLRPYSIIRKLYYYRNEFRHHHIAYCEFRGRKREEVEQPAVDNLPDDTKINEIKERMIEAMEEKRNGEETLCASS